jgi:hypothetical protein
MAESITEPNEVAAVGKLVKNGEGYLVSITRDYAEDLRRITAKRVLVTIKPLV